MRRLMQRTLWLAATVILLLAADPALSQPSTPTLVADKDIGVFAAPRNGLFCQRGEKLGDLKRGTEISDYESVQAYCGLLFQFPYLRVTYSTSDGKIVSGYVHRTDDDGKDRFHVKAQ